ncbi:MAG: hypothetical protein HY308_08305 [Gammaproteobacteria bacterium]|nr:hypothetical protein [Gammaproteobacteria bacterium]
MEFIEDLDKRVRTEQCIPGPSTGFTGLDVITGGLEPTSLIVIAGRTSSGKTSLEKAALPQLLRVRA